MTNLLLDASVGIIGGADGPTSVYVASDPTDMLATALAAAIAVLIVLYFRKHQKKKR